MKAWMRSALVVALLGLVTTAAQGRGIENPSGDIKSGVSANPNGGGVAPGGPAAGNVDWLSYTQTSTTGAINFVAPLQLPALGRISCGTDTADGGTTSQALLFGPLDPNTYAVGVGPSLLPYNFGYNGIAMGSGAFIYANGSGDNNLVLGSLAGAYYNAGAGGSNHSCFRNTVVGAQFARAQGYRNAVYGNGASAAGQFNLSMGDYSSVGTYVAPVSGSGSVEVTNSTAIGRVANVQHNFSTALGNASTTTADHQIMLGTSAETVAVPGTATFTGVASFTAGASIKPASSGGELSFGGNIVYESDGSSTYLSPSNDTTGSVYVFTGGAQRAQFNSTGDLTLAAATALKWSGFGGLSQASSGVYTLTDAAGDNAVSLQLGTGTADSSAGNLGLTFGTRGNANALNISKFGAGATLAVQTGTGQWTGGVASYWGLNGNGGSVLGISHTSGTTLNLNGGTGGIVANSNTQIGTATTHYHGIDTAPVVGQTLTIKGSTLDNSAYPLYITKSDNTPAFLVRGTGSILSYNVITANIFGTAASPAFVTATQAGLWSPTTNQLGFSTAGLAAGLIDASQNWSIASSSSNYLQLGSTSKLLAPADGTLQLTSSTGTFGTLQLGGSTASTGVKLISSNGALTLQDGANSGVVALNITASAGVTAMTTSGQVNFGEVTVNRTVGDAFRLAPTVHGRLSSDSQFGWASGSGLGTTRDLSFYRSAAGVVGVNNGSGTSPNGKMTLDTLTANAVYPSSINPSTYYTAEEYDRTTTSYSVGGAAGTNYNIAIPNSVSATFFGTSNLGGVYLGTSSTSQGGYTVAGMALNVVKSSSITYQWRHLFYVGTLSDATNSYTLLVGSMVMGGSTTGSLPFTGPYLSYTHSTNSGQWVMASATGSVQTTANTTTAATTGWHNVTITLSNGVYTYVLDGSSVGTVTDANMATTVTNNQGASIGGVALLPNGAFTTARYAAIDRSDLLITGLSR